MRTVICGIAAVLIAGCASDSVTLANDRGERRTCYRAMGGGLTSDARAGDFQRCLTEAGMAGFKRVD